jgi:hypothetical protein
MLQDSQASLDDTVFENGTRRNVNSAALAGNNDDCALESDVTTQVHRTSDGEVVELGNTWDAGDALLEIRNLLEVRTQLNDRSTAETVGVNDELAVLQAVKVRLDKHQVRAGLDGQETTAGHVDTVSIAEMANSGTDGGFELDDGKVGFTLLVGGNGLLVGDNLHLQLVLLNNTLDGAEVHPDVVGVEVLELLDGLEFVDVLLGDLSNFQQTHTTIVVNDGTTLDVSLGLIGQFHDVFGLGVDHVLKNAQINNGTEVVGVGKEENLNTALKKLVKNSGVVEGLENVTVTGRVPVGDLGVEALGCGEQGILEDTGVTRLVECDDIDVVSLVLLDDVLGVIIGVEGVHENEGNVDVVCAVEVFDLADRQVKERHAFTDFDDGLGADATHGSSETTIELENSELVEKFDGGRVAKLVVVNDLARLGRSDALPVDGVTFGTVVQVTAEEGEEVVHLSFEALLGAAILHGLGKSVQGISHLRSSDTGGSIFESLQKSASCSIVFAPTRNGDSIQRTADKN